MLARLHNAAPLAWLRSALSELDARDVVLAAGLLLLACGLVQVWAPAALIVPGAVLTYVAIMGPRLSGGSSSDDASGD